MDRDNTKSMEQGNKGNKLWHSAQSLDNISPTFIYEDKKPIPLEQHEERQKIVSKINNIVASATGKWSESSNVIIYYTYRNFVIESTPNQRDNYNRLSPILTYGDFYFFSEERDEEDWIKEVITEIDDFARSIDRELSSTTKEMIKKGLKETRKDLRPKKYQPHPWTKFIVKSSVLAMVLVTPLLLGWTLHEQVPQLLHHQLPLLKQKTQQDTLMALQPVIQNLIIRVAVLIAINNVILLGLALLITGMTKSGFKTTKK